MTLSYFTRYGTVLVEMVEDVDSQDCLRVCLH